MTGVYGRLAGVTVVCGWCVDDWLGCVDDWLG